MVTSVNNNVSNSSAGGGGNYTVKSGDTLSAIAQRNGVSLSELVKANPQISNINMIHPGQEIHVPGGGAARKTGSLSGVAVSQGSSPSERPAARPSSSGGGSYTVRSGDSLSAIAQRNGVSLNSMMAANPSIKNPNMIFAGQQLNMPGGRSTASNNDGISAGNMRPTGATSGGNGDAFNIARGVLGNNISSLKYNGPLASVLDKWPGNNVCCANFVSACLQKAGQISGSEHNDSVKGLAANLRNDSRWSQTSLANAKPGDVVCFNVPGEGPMSHVVMFAGFQNGSPMFIGSNNVNSDGSQRITESHMGYPIGAVFHFNG